LARRYGLAIILNSSSLFGRQWNSGLTWNANLLFYQDINSIFDDESDSPMLFHRKEKPKKGLGGVFCAALLVLLNIFVLAVLIFQAFAVYQSVALAADHRDTAYYPGNFFPVTEHKYKLRLNCVGGLLPARNGSSPTIILESGLGGVTPYWSYVLPGLANLTRVCEYDRAGYGWSQSGVLPRSSQQIAQGTIFFVFHPI
jgi:hypothetical protein